MHTIRAGAGAVRVVLVAGQIAGKDLDVAINEVLCHPPADLPLRAGAVSGREKRSGVPVGV